MVTSPFWGFRTRKGTDRVKLEATQERSAKKLSAAHSSRLARETTITAGMLRLTLLLGIQHPAYKDGCTKGREYSEEEGSGLTVASPSAFLKYAKWFPSEFVKPETFNRLLRGLTMRQQWIHTFHSNTDTVDSSYLLHSVTEKECIIS